jgi:DNA helicase-2/ATP-dependent DNA helicase PcrA
VAEPSRFLSDLPDAVVDGKPRKNSELLQATMLWDGGKPTAPRSAEVGTRFKPGDKVMHPRFGEGLVLRSTRVRDDEEVEVFFLGVGGKRLSAEMSGLKKLRA